MKAPPDGAPGDRPTPPRVARAILRRLLPDALIDPIEGDLEEGFRRRVESAGRFRAHGWYWAEVVRMPYLSLRRRAAGLVRWRSARRSGIVTWMGGEGMMAWLRELRVAWRSLVRWPAFALTSVVTLALSLGAATLLFSVTEAVLLRPLPFPDSDRIVNLYLMNEEWRESDNALLRGVWDSHFVHSEHLEAWRANPVGLDEVGSYSLWRERLQVGDEGVEGAYGLMVDEGFFETLAIPTILGRTPSPEEFRTRARVAVVSERVWRSLFGSDPEITGRTFRFRDDVYTVVGVMPDHFPLPTSAQSSFWAPHTTESEEGTRFGIGRLSEGATAATASEALDRVARRIGEEDPSFGRFGARAMLLLDDIVSGVRSELLFLLLTAIAVLLVACVNLANLILVRGAARRGELAVRTAIGASKAALFHTVFAEVFLICLVGGCAGVGLAYFAMDPFVSALAVTVGGLPREGEVTLNGAVLLFAALATLSTALAAGLTPALRGALRPPAATLSEAHRGSGAGRSGRRAQRGLLLAQSGLTAVLLIGTGLLVRSAVHAAHLDPGYDYERLGQVTLRFEGETPAAGDDRSAALALLEQRLSALPEVSAVTMASTLPIVGGATVIQARREPDPGAPALTFAYSDVGPSYFDVLGIDVLAGRLPERLDSSETGPTPVALSAGAAESLFGDENPLGQRYYSGESGESEVVAVVADARFWFTREPYTQAYRLRELGRYRVVMIGLRTGSDPAEVARRAAELIEVELPAASVLSSGSLAAPAAESTAHLRARAVLMVTLGLLAALLTVFGIAGVVAHFLAEQTREVAVRMALGALPRGEARRILGLVLTPAVAGLAGGVVAALWLSRLAEGVVFEISVRDPVAFIGAAVLVLLLALFAAWLPARRTTAIAPAQVLNSG